MSWKLPAGKFCGPLIREIMGIGIQNKGVKNQAPPG